MQFETNSDEETIALGQKLVREVLPRRGVVLLTGGLGAGKTTLAKGITEGLGAARQEDVSSPTFTLIHEYGEPPAVYHIDLYRLDEERQAAALGIEELLEHDALVLVEWGERFPGLWPEERIEIHIERTGADQRRFMIRL
jgi:tRNA threonylcarbamoyladenosine biosynthesis protein TsaE